MKDHTAINLSNPELSAYKFGRKESSISTELEGETIILDFGSGVYSGLNSIGTFIWNELQEPITFSDLKDKVLDEYEVDDDECVNDLVEFLQDLARNDLLTVADESSI